MQILRQFGVMNAAESLGVEELGEPRRCSAAVLHAQSLVVIRLCDALPPAANALLALTYNISFHQWGVTVFACGTACTIVERQEP